MFVNRVRLLFRLFCSLLFIFLIAGCASNAIQSEKILANRNNLPIASTIENVSFIDQSVGYCGPATLTMAMQHAGHAVKIENIAAQVYTPGFKGSLQSDMISTSRRQGMTAIPIQDLSSLLSEVSDGNPVIIFQNLALSWMPQWHYALILGYDLQKKEIIMHSGHKAYTKIDMADFERSWRLGDYWGLVVLPAGKLAASASELSHAAAAVGLEQANKFNEAEISYRGILKKWPTSLVALIGLSNLTFKKGHYKETISLLKLATKSHPESEAAKHNLAVVMGAFRSEQ